MPTQLELNELNVKLKESEIRYDELKKVCNNLIKELKKEKNIKNKELIDTILDELSSK